MHHRSHSLEKPRLSVGIPVYNQGAYLDKTIESLLAQHEKPFEIVVSNNWSTDSTEQVAQRYAEHIRLIRPPAHLQVTAHFNFVASALQGDWFSLLSADDEAKQNYVGALLRGIMRHDDAVLVRAGYELIGEHSEHLGTRLILTAKRRLAPPHTFYEQLAGPKVNFSAFAIRKSTWEAVHGFPENIKHSPDWGMWLRLSAHGSFAYENQVISRYRVNYRPGIDRARFLNSCKSSVLIYQEVIPEVLELLPAADKARVTEAAQQRCIHLIASAVRHNFERNEREEIAQCLMPWATTIGCTEAVESFRAGQFAPAKGRLRSIKARVRPLVQWLAMRSPW